MKIDFVPDPAAQSPMPFDPDAYLASSAPPPPVPAIDTTGWKVVPATVEDQKGFTIADYEAAAEDFLRPGDEYSEELSAQAVHRAFEMRKWLVTAQGCGSN